MREIGSEEIGRLLAGSVTPAEEQEILGHISRSPQLATLFDRALENNGEEAQIFWKMVEQTIPVTPEELDTAGATPSPAYFWTSLTSSEDGGKIDTDFPGKNLLSVLGPSAGPLESRELPSHL